MTSFLVITKDKQNRQEYIRNFCKERAIASFDITSIEKDETKQSIGIAEIKLMQKKLFLKPLHSQTKAVILEDAQLLTTEAQNAMLKVLEEPPAHTIIILAADSEEPLLPTIQSRCQIIKLAEISHVLSEAEEQEIALFLSNLNQMTISQALKKAEVLAKDKQSAIEWIEKAILVSRKKMLAANDESTVAFHIIKSFQSLHTLLKTTNVNPRFAIESTLLSVLQYPHESRFSPSSPHP